MSYYYSSLIGWLVVFSILAIVVYSIRHHLPSALTTSLNIFPSAFSGGNEETSRSLYSRIPAYDWTASRLAGLHSTLFDIEANVRDLDDRTGLEGAGAAEVHRLMQTHGVDFDTARLMLNRSRFSKNNIDPRTGMPLDSKAVTFENLR